MVEVVKFGFHFVSNMFHCNTLRCPFHKVTPRMTCNCHLSLHLVVVVLLLGEFHVVYCLLERYRFFSAAVYGHLISASPSGLEY